MERFVRLVVGGGMALVVGLWIGNLAARWSLPWLVGAALVVLGAGGLAVGIASQVEFGSPTR